MNLVEGLLKANEESRQFIREIEETAKILPGSGAGLDVDKGDHQGVDQANRESDCLWRHHGNDEGGCRERPWCR